MAFDFFNEGLKKEVGVEFTKEENAYLPTHIAFLRLNSHCWTPPVLAA